MQWRAAAASNNINYAINRNRPFIDMIVTAKNYIYSILLKNIAPGTPYIQGAPMITTGAVRGTMEVHKYPVQRGIIFSTLEIINKPGFLASG